MSGFRKQTKVLREASGSYTNGLWSPGLRSIATINASLQPISGKSEYENIQALSDGRHLSDLIKIYTNDMLNISSDGEGKQSDIIVHEGYGYEINGIDIYQSNVINHYKYMAVKIFKFTTDSDWLAGILKRP